MTHKDFSTIQRMLGFIEGAIFDHDKSVNCGILDARNSCRRRELHDIAARY